MVVVFWRTTRDGSEKVGQVDDRGQGPKALVDLLLSSGLPLAEAMCDAPRRFNGAYLRAELVGQKYSPDQPRVPAGDPQGGQWTSGGRNALGFHDELIQKAIWKAAGDTGSTGNEHGGRIYEDANGHYRVEPVTGTTTSIKMGNMKNAAGDFHTHPMSRRFDALTHIPPSVNDLLAHAWDAWDSGRDDYTSVVAALHRDDPGITIYTITGRPKERPNRYNLESNTAQVQRAIAQRLDDLPNGTSEVNYRQAVVEGLREGALHMGLNLWIEEWQQ